LTRIVRYERTVLGRHRRRQHGALALFPSRRRLASFPGTANEEMDGWATFLMLTGMIVLTVDRRRETSPKK